MGAVIPSQKGLYRLPRHSAALLATVLLAALCGCGGPKSIEVTGTVSYKDQPVPAGVIFFDPDPMKKHNGPTGFAYIKEGRFNTREQGRGVRPGPHQIRVHGFDGKPGEELPMGKLIFPEYTKQAELLDPDTPLDVKVPVAPAPVKR
jgi:hypothetical protein